MGAIGEAAHHTQVIVTSHSPDLLDQVDLDACTLLAVQSDKGNTQIGNIDRASREAIRTTFTRRANCCAWTSLSRMSKMFSDSRKDCLSSRRHS